MKRFARFFVVGCMNAAIDYGILFTFIAVTGVANGPRYALFKGISFTIATINSYVMNKYWTFSAGYTHGGAKELGRFATVALAGAVVNVFTASRVVAAGPQFGITPVLWAVVGAIAGSAAALLCSFTGFQLFVFRKRV